MPWRAPTSVRPLWQYGCGGDGLMRLNHRIWSCTSCMRIIPSPEQELTWVVYHRSPDMDEGERDGRLPRIS